MKTFIEMLMPLLLVAFIVLKLCKIISWSWWWITSPLWLPIALLLVGLGAAYFIVWLVGKPTNMH